MCRYMIDLKKSIMLIFVFVLLSFSAFADDKNADYLKVTVDIDGELVEYYCIKDEDALDRNFRMLVSNTTGQFKDIPNLFILKKNMISEKYIKKNYPEFYKKYMKEQNDNSSVFKFADKYDYLYVGIPYSSSSGLIAILQKNGSEKYYSFVLYIDDDEYLYTKDLLNSMVYMNELLNF